MELRERKKIRLQGRDYSRSGYYFITICVDGKWPILCTGIEPVPVSIIDKESVSDTVFPLSEVGSLVDQCVRQISVHYPGVVVDRYVIMPNHIHMILFLKSDSGRTLCAPTQKRSVSIIVRMLKETVTKALGYSIWQKSFHDHIIRDEAEYLRICEYIRTNPAKWHEDCYYAVPKEL